MTLDLTFPADGPSTDPAEVADFVQSLIDDINASIASTAAGSGTYSVVAGASATQVVITYVHGSVDSEVDSLVIDLGVSEDADGCLLYTSPSPRDRG